MKILWEIPLKEFIFGDNFSAEMIYKETVPFNWWSGDIFGMGCISSAGKCFTISKKFTKDINLIKQHMVFSFPQLKRLEKQVLPSDFSYNHSLCKEQIQT